MLFRSALAGITVMSVPAYNIRRGPAPGQFYHPMERGQGYVLTFSDNLAAVRDNKAASVYVAGDTECVPAIAQWVKNGCRGRPLGRPEYEGRVGDQGKSPEGVFRYA